jgi:tetratricopeptide (TPR) repeat protein
MTLSPRSNVRRCPATTPKGKTSLAYNVSAKRVIGARWKTFNNSSSSPRQTILASKAETLADDHPSKPKGSIQLSQLFQGVVNHLERKRLLTHALELNRQRGDDAEVVQTLRRLSYVNQLLDLYQEGIRQAKEALEIFERNNDTVEQAQVLNTLAELLLDDEQLDAAEDAASRAIDLVPEKGQEFTVCQLHQTLGRVHQSTISGRPSQSHPLPNGTMNYFGIL